MQRNHQQHWISTIALLFLLHSLTFFAGCKKKDEPEPVDQCQVAIDTHEWGYDDFGGPTCWNATCDENTCLGDKQSPIDIVNAQEDTTLADFVFYNNPTLTKIEHKHHSLYFEMEPGIGFTFGLTTNGVSNDFALGQFHFHAGSEHKVGGVYSPMEMHMVHRSIWENKYIVLSVMFEEGQENTFLTPFISHLPAVENGLYLDSLTTYSPYDILPVNKSYYTYAGSLTTPPCSEIVTWVVFEEKVQASATQIEAFATILEGNFRPIQPLNGRTIKHVPL